MKPPVPLLLAATTLLFAITGCGHQPAYIGSARDIARTSSTESMIAVGQLPLEDWPKLQKFAALEHMRTAPGTAPAVTDDHIMALSNLKVPKLRQISLSYCREVTDVGFGALRRLTSIEGLQLIGTSITDDGLKVLVTELPNLKGINVEKCRAITVTGLSAIRESKSIRSVGLSLDPLSQASTGLRQSNVAGHRPALLPNLPC
ncbi:MAG: hypothetical protein IPN11_02500 [Opitutaceae bacterium]|nr:hypothetical protein [Opitutaceae bacterium]